jgi:hypothetical protein
MKPIFKNTDLFQNVDWDTEIQTDEELDDESHARNASDYALVMHLIKDSIDKMVDSEGADKIEEHKKGNSMRMLEFMYAKFMYHHAMFYRKKDFLNLKFEDNKHYRNPIIESREKLGETKYESNLPLEILQETADALIASIRKRLDDSKPKDGGFEEAKAMFEKEGIEVQKPVGIGKESDRDTVCTLYDGIPYHMYLMKSSSHRGKREQAEVKKEVEEFRELVDKYHPLIKRVFIALKKQFDGLDDLWVLSGGGMQLQAFFGSNGKYICILYLGLKGEKPRQDKSCNLIFQCFEDEEKWQTYKRFNLEDLNFSAFDKTNPFKDDKF